MASKKIGGRSPRSFVAKPRKAVTLAEHTFGQHFTELQRLVDRASVAKLKPLYRSAKLELESALRRFSRSDQRVEPATLRAMLKQVDAVMSSWGSELTDHLKDTGHAATVMGARQGGSEFQLLARHFEGTAPTLRIDQPAQFAGLIDGVDSSLLRRYELQSNTWTNSAIISAEEVMRKGTMIGTSTETMVDQLESALETERWKAERIMRTELMNSHGSAKLRAIDDASRELGRPMWKRLVENFSSGQPNDDRCGDDSYLIHGQTVPLDKPFTCKFKRRGSWVLHEFMHPPNRPNDRAVVIPWDLEWDDTDLERPLTTGELLSAAPTRWRRKVGIDIPPGHVPGKSY